MRHTKKPKVRIKRTKTSLGYAYRIYLDGAYAGTGLTQASAREARSECWRTARRQGGASLDLINEPDQDCAESWARGRALKAQKSKRFYERAHAAGRRAARAANANDRAFWQERQKRWLVIAASCDFELDRSRVVDRLSAITPRQPH